MRLTKEEKKWLRDRKSELQKLWSAFTEQSANSYTWNPQLSKMASNLVRKFPPRFVKELMETEFPIQWITAAWEELEHKCGYENYGAEHNGASYPDKGITFYHIPEVVERAVYIDPWNFTRDQIPEEYREQLADIIAYFCEEAGEYFLQKRKKKFFFGL